MSTKLTKPNLINTCNELAIKLNPEVKYKNRDLIKLIGNYYYERLPHEDLSWGLDRRLELESLSLCYRYTDLKTSLQDELWISQDYIAEIKKNGCFEGSTLITLEDGSQKTIKEIVDNKLEVKVLSYNESTKKLEAKKVINWFNNGLKPRKEWVKIKAGNTKGKQTKSTLTHKFYNSDTYTWIPISDMPVGTNTFKIVNNFNSTQREVIAGMLLGDTCLQKDKRGSQSYRLVTVHSIKQKDYFDKKYECLANYLLEPSKTISGYGSTCYRVVSKVLPEADYYIKMYSKIQINNNSFKVITKDYLDLLTPLSLAIWFMDDGNRTKSNLESKVTNKVSRASLATHSFTYDSVVLLSNYLKEKGYNNNILKQKNLFYIAINSESSQSFFRDIAPYIPKSMEYKLPENLRNIPKIDWYTNQIPTPFLYKTPLTYKKECETMETTKSLVTAYDIEVEDNHNYFANNTLVHNCRVLLTYHPEEGFRFFSRHVSLIDYLPIDYTCNVLLQAAPNEALAKTNLPITKGKNRYINLGTEYVGIFQIPFIIDCEIVASSNIDTQHLLKYGGTTTESEQNATSVLLSCRPEIAHEIQIAQDVILELHAFDTIFFTEDIQGLTYSERYTYLEKLVSSIKPYIPIELIPRFFSQEQKKIAWETELANKGEGLVFKNITKPYAATESRKRDVQIKLKRSLSVVGTEFSIEDIDVFITGFVDSDKKRGRADLIGGVILSVYIQENDDTETLHEIATISSMDDKLRQEMTIYDSKNKPVLAPHIYNKVISIDGMSITKNDKFSHARSKFEFRTDKTSFDCKIPRMFLDYNKI